MILRKVQMQRMEASRTVSFLNGYASLFHTPTRKQNIIQVLNLNDLKRMRVFCLLDGDVLETTMDDIELSIILDHYKRDRKYMKEIV